MTKVEGKMVYPVTRRVASTGDTVNVNLYQPTTVSGTTFKTGEAKFLLKDNKVTLKQGKVAAEAAVKVESNNAKYSFTSIVYKDDHSIKEICGGGTTTRIVFESPSSAPSAAGQK